MMLLGVGYLGCWFSKLLRNKLVAKVAGRESVASKHQHAVQARESWNDTKTMGQRRARLLRARLEMKRLEMKGPVVLSLDQ